MNGLLKLISLIDIAVQRFSKFAAGLVFDYSFTLALFPINYLEVKLPTSLMEQITSIPGRWA